MYGTPFAFQSTHPRGVRHAWSDTRIRRLCFNPRTREGCDHRLHLQASGKTVSIHAPARGATQLIFCSCRAYCVSIHAPARGATPRSGTYWCGDCGFNPRTREGCDLLPKTILNMLYPFQSTHPRGVRHNAFALGFTSFQVSIHAPARGATARFTCRISAYLFQSTHPRGVRLPTCMMIGKPRLFQSTHPRGVRRTFHLR